MPLIYACEIDHFKLICLIIFYGKTSHIVFSFLSKILQRSISEKVSLKRQTKTYVICDTKLKT